MCFLKRNNFDIISEKILIDEHLIGFLCKKEKVLAVELSGSLLKFVKEYSCSKKHIQALIASMLKNSLPLNLYRDILKKKGRIAVESETEEEQIKTFSDYLLSFLSNNSREEIYT